MVVSSPIADMLTRIRNANIAGHDSVDVPASKMKLAIAEILLENLEPEYLETTTPVFACNCLSLNF